MKSVLLSIQPKWCEKIASGEKTVEVRKTRPKIEPPFKCYIYETKGEKQYYSQPLPIPYFEGKGKVIGEFVCDRIIAAGYGSYSMLSKLRTRIHEWDLLEYADGKTVYGWHISDLVVYDKPKDLIEFQKYPRKLPFDPVQRPPQSWCYVEEESD